jgi:hypothetical protein
MDAYERGKQREDHERMVEEHDGSQAKTPTKTHTTPARNWP